MIQFLLTAASLGIIGLVSVIWLQTQGVDVKKYVDTWKTELIKRAKQQFGGSSSSSSSTSSNEGKKGPSEDKSAKGSTPPELPRRPHAKNAANVSSSPSSSPSAMSPKSSHNLLQMAMAAPPVPKRPVLNIMHAPTLTKSFSPSVTPPPTHLADDSPPYPHSNSHASHIASVPEEEGEEGAEGVPAKPAANATAEEKMKAHREQVQWEFVSSEERYIHSLTTLMNVYFNPLKAKADKGSSKISKEAFSTLFSNIEAIWKFHQLLLPSLKTSKDGNIASVIQSHADYLKMYTKFCGDYNNALQTINQLHKNEDFVRFLKKQRENDVANPDGLDIMSFLIMPVQRVPRYLLLLKELQRYTPTSHPHSAAISSAIEKIGKIALHINEEQRHHENASILLEFQHQIQNLPVDLTLFEPHRRLIRFGILKLVKQEGTAGNTFTKDQIGSNFHVILFNDLLLYTTTEDHDFRGSMELHSTTLNTDGNVFEIVREKSASYRVQMSVRFECPSADEALKWKGSLKESISAANELQQKDQRRRSAASNSMSSFSR